MVKKLIKRPLAKRATKKSSAAKTAAFERSSLEIFDVPDHLIDDSPDNPQEMDDPMFDELVEGIKREGFDEPIHLIRQYEDGKHNGRWTITSGHHRRKAGRIVGMTHFPAILKKDMDDAARKIALVRRNQLHGTMSNKKFSALFREVGPILGVEMTKRLMGFTKEAAFKRVYDEVARSLPDGGKKTMEEAKETVRSVDDLSSILNGIFRQEGSKVENGYMVFSYGGKKHHYFQIGKGVSKLLENIEHRLGGMDLTADAFFAGLLKDYEIPTTAPMKKRIVKRGKTPKT